MWTQVAAHITQVTGQPFEGDAPYPVGGGCINQGYRFSNGQRTFFVKLNQASLVAMFEAEALGLQQIRATETIRVPQPICWGTEADNAYLVLEWIHLGRGAGPGPSWQEMGRRLAALHRAKGEISFGWDRNNTIGSTPQINIWTTNWTEFFIKHRIEYQLVLAQQQGGHFPKQSYLLAVIPELLAGYSPQPSLVHGDLWSGNAAIADSGEPVIFDPASYYGDREVDIAMTELFGGFPPEFYQGYQEVFPLDPGYQRRKTLYNLYHILNHFNLFGGSYEAQANRMIEQIVSHY